MKTESPNASPSSEKITLVLGASLNPARYSHRAVNMLTEAGYKTLALGGRVGSIGTISVEKDRLKFKGAEVHTITLYLNAKRQLDYQDFILDLKPKRIIFNPGTENPELFKLASEQGIECTEACNLVMLSLNQF